MKTITEMRASLREPCELMLFGRVVGKQRGAAITNLIFDLIDWAERARAALEDEKVYAETAEALLAELEK